MISHYEEFAVSRSTVPWTEFAVSTCLPVLPQMATLSPGRMDIVRSFRARVGGPATLLSALPTIEVLSLPLNRHSS
jgi:hypothetical protein